jgi:hypothetical protein
VKLPRPPYAPPWPGLYVDVDVAELRGVRLDPVGNYSWPSQPYVGQANRAPDRMRPEETDAKWFQNPRRLPWCAVCQKTIPHVTVNRMPISGDREFIVECHGARERTVLSEAEVQAMQGYGRAFAAEGARDG